MVLLDPESPRLTPESLDFDPLDDSEHDSVLESYYRFALEDLEEIRRSSKGKGTTKTDAEYALDLFAEDAEAILTSIGDMMLAQSIQKALETDKPILEELAQIERREQEDHKLALSLSKGAFSAPPSSQFTVPSSSSGMPSTSLAKFPMATARVSPASSELTKPHKPVAGSSNSTSVVRIQPASLRNVYGREKHECVVCMDTISGLAIKVPCGHYYDRKCLVDLFTETMTDESLFPPRCCRQEIPLEHVRELLQASALKIFEEKSLEFSTQIRLYCSNKVCSRFLGPRGDVASNIFCPACSESTCVICSEPGHAKDVPCKDDEAAHVVLALGRQNGWQRCPGCRQLVELNIGCYHMTCRCRTQFCYLCAEIWKNCMCPQWDEGRLVAAAEQRVERMPMGEGQNAGLGNFADLVIREVANLRVNHHCEHVNFAYRSGGGRCEQCNSRLPAYLMRCTGCQMLLCRRCRWNRV